MKIGGMGVVDPISRFDQTKTAGSDAKASDALSSSAASPGSSSSAAPITSKRAPRSSNVSKEDSKDFSRVLAKTEKRLETPNDAAEDTSEVDASTEALAGSAAVASPTVRSVKPVPSEASEESRQALKAPSASINSNPSKTKSDSVLATGDEATATTAIDEKVSAILESLNETAETELSMRHMSMRDFLGKMKAEFGIEPNAIVKAFAKLDQSALMAPPEQTAEAVLGQLGLKPEQMPKAERFYREMLNQTGESALNETMAGVGAGMTLKVLSEQDLAMERLQKSISSLNDTFARREPSSNATTAVAAPTAAAAMLSAKDLDSMSVVSSAPVASTQAVVAEASAPVTPEVAPNLGVLTEDAPSVDSSKNEKSESKFASLGAALSAATAGLAGAMAGGSSSGSGQDDSQKSKSDGKDIVKPREFNSIESALAGSGFSVPAGEQAATPIAAGTSTSAALAASLLGANSDNGTATNAQDLVRHAQILAKNGGGEMKMQLKPEGVGDVHLRVAVKDGQVAIQMLTENDSAKKILESSLDDLKTSLAQHKLHVDALKIEVGGEMAKQRFEQAQQDSSREQARQMAQDFMGQFRQDREGFRQGFADMSGFKNYQQPRRNPLPETETVAASAAAAKQKNSGERRLNLVA